MIEGQYGVRLPSGQIQTEEHWTSVSEVMNGTQGFGITSASEWGDLVRWNGSEWVLQCCSDEARKE